MKTYRGLATLLLFAIGLWAPLLVYAGDSNNTVQVLIKALRAQLPEGWKLSFEEKDSWIEIQRIKPELIYTIAENSGGDEKPTSQHYTIGLKIGPFVSKDEYQRLQSENKVTGKKMELLYDKLTRSRPEWGWPGSFQPANDEEKREFAEYNRLDASLHPLPDFYFENLSLTCSPDNQRPADDKIKNECKQVRDKIIRVLSTY